MYEPTRTLTKVYASGAAGAVVTILMWVLKQYAGIEMPQDVAAALTVLIMTIAAWVTPLLPGEVRRIPIEPPPVDVVQPAPDDAARPSSDGGSAP